MSIEQRNTFRRSVNGLAMRDGETHESKLWAQIGKVLCVWLIWVYAEALINHWEVLLVLISWLIAPDIAKKAITMRFGGDGQVTMRDTHEETTREITRKPVEKAKK